MRVLKTAYAIDITEEESQQAYLAYLWSIRYRAPFSDDPKVLDLSEHLVRTFGLSGYRERSYVFLLIPSDRDTPEFRDQIEAWVRNFLSEAIMQMKAEQGLTPLVGGTA